MVGERDRHGRGAVRLAPHFFSVFRTSLEYEMNLARDLAR